MNDSTKNVMVCAGDMRIGKAGDKQIKDPRIGLTHNMGGFPAMNLISVNIVGL